MPKNAKTVDEINERFEDDTVRKIFGTTASTLDPEPFFDGAFERDTHSFCVFSSKKTIKMCKEHLSTGECHILMDATFKIVPCGVFKQLLILYIRVKHEVCRIFLIF